MKLMSWKNIAGFHAVQNPYQPYPVSLLFSNTYPTTCTNNVTSSTLPPPRVTCSSVNTRQAIM